MVEDERRRRRASRNRAEILDAAAQVIVTRGVDRARFRDIADAAGKPISTLQYAFGSLDDLIVATFDHAWAAERAQLSSLLEDRETAWERLVAVVTAGLDGFFDGDLRGRLWLESVRFGLRDPEVRADVLADTVSWRGLFSAVIADGIAGGEFHPAAPPAELATVILALVDGIGLAHALGDPGLAQPPSALALRAISLLLGRHPETMLVPPTNGSGVAKLVVIDTGTELEDEGDLQVGGNGAEERRRLGAHIAAGSD